MPSATISGHFSCDNSYAIWWGDQNSVITKYAEETNTSASGIFSGEDLTPIPYVGGSYLYIIAWSDDSAYQGLIGTFSGAVSIHTGDPRWRVLPTNKNKGNNEFPSQSEINASIAAAAAPDWKMPFVGAPNGGAPWNTSVGEISTDAKWVWHDSGRDNRTKYPNSPYVPFAGYNHDEFLIFRIPLDDFQEPKPESKGCCVIMCQCCCKEEKAPPSPPPPPKCCGSCVFEARLQRFRYISGKPGFLDGWAELSFVSHLDGNQFNYPTANGSYVRIGKRHNDFWTGWYPVNARVGITEVGCESPRQLDVMSEMIENPQKEKGLSAMLEGGRPWGASEVHVVKLECGKKPEPILQRVRLELGGNRTENLEVEIEYRFSQVTACSCCGAKG